MRKKRVSTPDGIGEDHGVIGIVGVAPWSIMDFLRTLYGMVDIEKDWHYPRALVDINTKMPSRGRHFELGEADFSPCLSQSITYLAEHGADVAVVPCNTAHIHYDRWARDHPIPVLHIGRECVFEIKRKTASNVAIMGGKSLRELRFYEELLSDEAIETTSLSNTEAAIVAHFIETSKKYGGSDNASLEGVTDIFKRLADVGVNGLILGCTDLLAMWPLAQRFIPHVVESNNALAQATLRVVAPNAALHDK